MRKTRTLEHRAERVMGADLGEPADEGGAGGARRMGGRSEHGGKNASSRRDGRLWDALALAGLAIATLLFAQRPSFGGAVGEASVATVTEIGAAAEPLPASIELNAGGTQLLVRPLSRAEANRMRAQGLPAEGLHVLAATGRRAVVITAGDVIVGVCGQAETADAARVIAALEDSRPACVLAATRGSVTERRLGGLGD